MTPEEHEKAAKFLELQMPDTDIGSCTVAQYLHAILRTLWFEKEGFSGKRPFGNSDWTCCMSKAAIRAGFVTGKIDEEHGWLDELDRPAFDKLVEQAIDVLCDMSGVLDQADWFTDEDKSGHEEY